MYDSRDSLVRKYYKKQERSDFGHQKDNCFVETHTIAGSEENVPLSILVPEGGALQTVFEDFTDNHNKILLQLSSVPTPVVGGTAPAQPLEVTIRTRNSRTPIIARIPGSPGPSLTDRGGTRIFQVENFESLTVSNQGTFLGTLNIFIQKTFCICCKDQKKKCDCWYN